MKLPKQAKKQFSGIIFDTHHWEQKLYDGTTRTFEMLSRPSTMQMIPIVGDKILIAYEEQPTKPAGYTLLGGRQEPGEEPLDGAKREFLEETGMTAESWELHKSFQPYSKIDWTIYRYILRDVKQIQEHAQEAGEKIELKEVTFDEFIDIATTTDFWCQGMSLEIFQMQKQGTLGKFKKLLFPN